MAKRSGCSSTLETQVLHKSKVCSVAVCLLCSKSFDSKECSPMCILCLCASGFQCLFGVFVCVYVSFHATTSNPKNCVWTPAALQPLLTPCHQSQPVLLCRPTAGQVSKPCSIGFSQASLNGKGNHKFFFFGNHLAFFQARCAQNMFHQSIHHLWGITTLPLHIHQQFFLTIHPVLGV